ncbi:MAG TPA: GFA family protein [Steroidobacteraceae bacterium]|nr:GFA family protein [Steroidobacteraceae bacterium]HVP32415.1 GFA family protein [Steroidobacteraceae bacterium]
MSQTVYVGGCLCGAVRYQIEGAVSNPCYCHCASCRRATGAPMVPWGTCARAALRMTRGRLSEYRSSAQVWRGFCASCGTSLTYRNEARAAEIDVTLASLDDPTLLAPRMHVWVKDRLPWTTIGDQLPRHDTGVPSD